MHMIIMCIYIHIILNILEKINIIKFKRELNLVDLLECVSFMHTWIYPAVAGVAFA